MDATSAKVFDRVYRADAWGGGSGSGSRGEPLEWYVGVVRGLAAESGWESATDVGCGDGAVAARLPFARYCGVDPAPTALALARAAAAGPGRRWLMLDAYRDRSALPPADVLLCKDVLIHWPNRMVVDWVAWVAGQVGPGGRWRHVLLTQCDGQRRNGIDVPLGGYRPLSPSLYPLRPALGDHAVVARGHGKAAILLGGRPTAKEKSTGVPPEGNPGAG